MDGWMDGGGVGAWGWELGTSRIIISSSISTTTDTDRPTDRSVDGCTVTAGERGGEAELS